MSTIKKCFISRFGKNGVIVEADYGQIEVVGQAFLSGDPQMKQDVRDGIDFHCKRLSFKLKEDYEELLIKCKDDTNEHYPVYSKKRKDIKVFSFRKAYGAGAKTIALGIGVPVAQVKEFFAIEEALYPEITKQNERWIDEVDASKKPSNNRTFKGFQACRGFINSVTGKRYIFTEEDVPGYMQKTWKDGKLTIKTIGFKPTKIKNYPVQGFAGELLYMAIGKLIRALLRDKELRSKCILMNTVHDSIIFDIHKDVLMKSLRLIKRIMLDVPKYMNEWFKGLNFDLPLDVEIKFGPNWLETQVVSIPLETDVEVEI